jgi:hypothetical protein
MFEKEIKFISDFITNKIKSLGTYFTYEELINSEIDPAVLKFISAEVDYRIYEDRQRLLQQSSFDYSGSEISKYFNLIGKEIKKSTKITYEDIKDVVTQAIAFNADYAVIPNEALKNLIFSKKSQRSAGDLKLMLNYIYYYPYLKDILIAYIDRKKISGLNSSQFTSILSEIDKEVFASGPKSVIENAINTLSSFYNIGSTDKNKLSINLVEIYLKEKNMDEFLNKLKKKTSKDSKQKYSVNEIKDILFLQAPTVIADEAAEEKTGKEAESIEVFSQKEEIVDTAEDEIKEKMPDDFSNESDKEKVEFDITKHDDLDALYNFNEDDQIKDNPNEKVKEELRNSDEFKAKEEKKAPVKKEDEILIPDNFDDKDEELHDSSRPYGMKEKLKKKNPDKKSSKNRDIFSYLSDKDIEKIVGYIFNDDREDFASTMEKISESESYEEATEILKNLFKAYNINPYSKDAIVFTNSVSNYFEQN